MFYYNVHLQLNCNWFSKAVLERGVLNYFASRADSTLSDQNKRRDFKYLDSARVTPLTTDSASFVVHFNDGSVHRLSVLSNHAGDQTQVDRQVAFVYLYCLFETALLS